MKNLINDFFLGLLFTFTGICNASYTLTPDDVAFENGTIKKYVGEAKDIIIPDKINGEEVKAIGIRAFQRKGITSLTLPNSLTVIEECAFEDCELKTLIIPKGVEKINCRAFSENNITKLTLPDTINVMEKWAFHRNNIQTVNGKTSDGFIYGRKKDGSVDFTVISSLGRKEAKQLVIPNGVKEIQWNLFARMGVKTLVIPESVTYIECSAFGNNSITMLNGKPSNGIIYQRNKDGSEDRTRIMSFGGTSKIIDFIPETVTYIASHSFMGNEIEKVILPKNLKYIGWQAFRNNKLKEIVIPKGVTKITPFSFGSNDLTKVTILNENAIVKKGAFNDNNIKTVNGKPFNGFFYKQKKDGTKDLSTIVSYGKKTEKGSTIEIPKHVTSIGDLAFECCYIGNFSIPSHITSIGESAFDDYRKIDKTLPSPVAATAYWVNSKGQKVTTITNHKLRYKVYYPPTCYTVDYNSNGGVDGTVISEKVLAEKNVKLLGNPVRAGFELSSWNSRADGKGTQYNSSFKVTDNLTLYAQWEPTVSPLKNETIAISEPKPIDTAGSKTDVTVTWDNGSSQGGERVSQNSNLIINSGWNLIHVPETMHELWKNDDFNSNDFWMYLEGNPFKGTAKYSRLPDGEIPQIGEGFWVMGGNSDVQNYEFDNQEYLNEISPVIELQQGWNIVGVEKPLPIKLDDMELWSWDSLTQGYKKYKLGTNLVPTKGYWLFVKEPALYLKEAEGGKSYIINGIATPTF